MKTQLRLILLCLLLGIKASAQFDVTGIYTDYNSFWQSSTTTVSSIKPDRSHNLLAFTWNGTTYSTGVADATLTSRGVSFSPKDFRAFPIDAVPAVSGTYIGLGQLQDGVNNGGTSPGPFSAPANAATLASFLTDGVKGLDLGTGIANVAAGQVRFNLSALGVSTIAINDGIPDVVVTQIAQPASALDSIYFVDGSGNVVGTKLAINQTTVPVTGKWMPDFYLTSGNITIVNSERDIRLWAADLTSFGITAANAANVAALIYRMNGSSDVAFVAFNTPSLSIATKLTVTTQPSPLTNPACCGNSGTAALAQQPIVQLQDAFGNNIQQANISVTASILSGPVGSGALTGTTTVVTNSQGQAVFTDLVMPCDTGVYKLTFTSSNLEPANSTNVTVSKQYFYVKPSGISNLSSLSSWSSLPDGSGPTPSDFGSGKEFILKNNNGDALFSTGNDWTVTGKLTIPTGKTMTVTTGTTTTLSCEIAHTGLIESGNTSTLVLNGTNQQSLDGISNLKNLTISNPSGVVLSAGTKVDKTLKLTTGTLSVNATSLTLNGTISKTSGIINAAPNNSTVIYSGSAAQTLLSSAFNGGIGNLTINNPAGVTVSSDLTVNNNLTMTSGLLTLNSSHLVAGSFIGGSSNSYVQTNGTGKLKSNVTGAGGAKAFPVGNSTYNPVQITNDNSATDQYMVRVLDEVFLNSLLGAIIFEPHVIRTWNIQRSTNISPSGSRFLFNWIPNQNNGVTHPSMYHFFGLLWLQATDGIGSSPSTTSYNYAGYNSLSTFFAVIESPAVTPVRIQDFQAERQNKYAKLSWRSMTAETHYDFVVERSNDGTSWSPIGVVQSPGNGYSTNSFTYTDINPSTSNHYRIKQVNKDGSFIYTEIRAVRFDTQRGFTVLGNPVKGNAIKLRVDEKQDIGLYNMTGNLIWQKTFMPGAQSAPVGNLSSGTYFLKSQFSSATILVTR